MFCDKDESIRVLSLYLKETQAQYNDCFSEAAEQDALMDLQRDAIQKLQKTILCKDLVYYSMLIKAQELFRGRIQDVRNLKSKIEGLVKSKRYLEDKCRTIKRLWREADTELRNIKSTSQYKRNAQLEARCKDFAICTDFLEFGNIREMQIKINELQCENEDLKQQLQQRRLEFHMFDREFRNKKNNDDNDRKLAIGTDAKSLDTENSIKIENDQLESVLKEHLAYARILITELQLARERQISRTNATMSIDRANVNAVTIKDEDRRRNDELDNLIAEAQEKQPELGMIKDVRKEFERTKALERMNECLRKELIILRESTEREEEYCMARKVQSNEDLSSEEVEDPDVTCEEAETSRQSEIKMIEQLKYQLLSTRKLTEECLIELRNSKEMLGCLRERVFSLKKLLKETSDELAKLQADHQIIKNDYSILKSENSIFEEKARAEIRESREKLKALQSELRLVEDNYRRVSKDFDKSQGLLIEAARREVDLQHAITNMEQIFCAKLSSSKEEGKRLSELADMLRVDLENARDDFSVKELEFTEKWRDAHGRFEILEERIEQLEETKRHLTRQLQECRLENCSLIAENSKLMENGCRCVKELEDMQNVLFELKDDCKMKSRTLNRVSSELSEVAASRSELCEKSQNMLFCIRAWIEENWRLVETLSKKLKNEKNRCAEFAFEKKALLATVRELTEINDTTRDWPKRKQKCSLLGHSPCRRSTKSNCQHTSSLYYRTRRNIPHKAQQPAVPFTSTAVNARSLKRHCVCLNGTARRTLVRDNLCWIPKLERARKEFCGKNCRYLKKSLGDLWMNETKTDEARDFGYQSSSSK